MKEIIINGVKCFFFLEECPGVIVKRPNEASMQLPPGRVLNAMVLAADGKTYLNYRHAYDDAAMAQTVFDILDETAAGGRIAEARKAGVSGTLKIDGG